MQTMFQPLVTKKWISLQDFLAWRWDADAPLLYSSKWGELADGGCGKGGCLPFREIRHRSLIKWDLGYVAFVRAGQGEFADALHLRITDCYRTITAF